MSTKIVNYYDHIKKNTSDLRNYPNEDQINIKLPFRMMLVGPSGSGKTNILLNLIKMIGIFDRIVLLAKDLTEPLYQHLITTYDKIEKKYKIKMFLAIDSINDLPSPEDFDQKLNNLVICDDLICESQKDLKKVGAFWTWARKREVSMVFISQSYFMIPKVIRQNSTYVVIKKVSTPKDLKSMLKEHALGGANIDQLTAMYNHALQGDAHTSFFMIDTLTSNPGLRFRSNFAPIMS